MVRRTVSIDEKIERQKEIFFQLKDKYDAAVKELDTLQQKRNELKNKELLKAIESSNKSYDEILAFLTNTDEVEA